jgi:hypothetical protein
MGGTDEAATGDRGPANGTFHPEGQIISSESEASLSSRIADSSPVGSQTIGQVGADRPLGSPSLKLCASHSSATLSTTPSIARSPRFPSPCLASNLGTRLAIPPSAVPPIISSESEASLSSRIADSLCASHSSATLSTTPSIARSPRFPSPCLVSVRPLLGTRLAIPPSAVPPIISSESEASLSSRIADSSPVRHP